MWLSKLKFPNQSDLFELPDSVPMKTTWTAAKLVTPVSMVRIAFKK